jgi:hypothetical protein
MQGERANASPIFFQPKDSFLDYWVEERQKNKNIFINEYWGGVKTEINEKPAFYGTHNRGT